MKSATILCLLALCGVVNNVNGELWALLVAGSNGWENYRHQADLCHAYQILHAHGIPDERIVVMMYDDIADNPENPNPGTIINHPNGDDVYRNVPKDYTGRDVNPKNFVNILHGNKDAMRGIGSGKVIESGSNDHVFVNFVDHGGSGVLCFPNWQELTVKELYQALKYMHDHRKYSKMVLYIEACHSGSMLNNHLPSSWNIYATTAANGHESSYSCYYDARINSYLGDLYSVSWMEDSDKEDLRSESLLKQFGITKRRTSLSHVMEFGDMSVGNMHVSEFQGTSRAAVQSFLAVAEVDETPVSSYDAALQSLYHKREHEKTQIRFSEFMSDHELKTRTRSTTTKINEILKNRNYVEYIFKKLAAYLVSNHAEHNDVMTAQRDISDLDCHDHAVHAFSKHCFNFAKNPYSLKFAQVLVNLCETGHMAEAMEHAMVEVCAEVDRAAPPIL